MVAFLLFAAYGAVGLKRLWRRESTYWDAVPRWWPYGPRLWRGVLRIAPIAVATGLLAPLWVLGAMFVVPKMPSPTGIGTVVPGWYAAIILTLLGWFAVMAITVILLNWPKLIVPPHMRADPGFLGAEPGGGGDWTAEPRDRSQGSLWGSAGSGYLRSWSWR